MPKGLIGRVSSVLICLAVIAELLSVVFVKATVAATPLDLKINTGAPASLAWPAYGQAAIAAQGFGLLGQSGASTPVPTASVAKVITALAVLKQKPLAAAETGPSYTVSQTDVDNYQKYISEEGSVVRVQLGETISERQALEAMLLPSANNIAYSLASWVFGSLDNYLSFANKYVKTLGMINTHVSDASGFAPETVSTAVDLTKLAEAALANPVLAQIVNEQQATLPVAGVVKNTNWLLGQYGLLGIKTGNTSQAGGCFLFAATKPVATQTVTVYGAVLGAPDLYSAMVSARNLVVSSGNGFKIITALSGGQVVANYNSAWGASSPAVTKTPLSLLVWNGQAATGNAQLKLLAAGAPRGTIVGTVTAKAGARSVSVPVISGTGLVRPSIKYRLLHPSF